MHGEAKTQHGLRRAVRRGLSNVAIQAYLTAAVINLKRLVAFLGLFFAQYFNLRNLWHQRRYDVSTSEVCANFGRNRLWRTTGRQTGGAMENTGFFNSPTVPGMFSMNAEPDYFT